MGVKKNLIVGTDGGLKNEVGTTGVVTEIADDPTVNIKALGAEHCSKKTLQSNREELKGILTAEIILHQCSKLWGGHLTRDVTSICDSKNALKDVEVLKENWKQRDVMKAEAEVAMQIYALREGSKLIRDYIWTKGNQIEDEVEDINSNWVRVNNIADALATEARDNVNEGLIMAEPKQFLPASNISLTIAEKRISKQLKKSIHQVVSDTKLVEFLCTK